MPNWCDNLIIVTGRMNRIFELVGWIDDGSGNCMDFNRIAPIPLGVMEKDGSFGEMARHWLMENWGPTREIESCQYLFFEDKMEITFPSAWGPATGITKAMARKFPDLRFQHQYQEGWNNFSGVLICEEGQLLKKVGGDFLEYFYGDVRDYFNIDEVDGGREYLEILSKLFKVDLKLVFGLANSYPKDQWYTGLVDAIRPFSSKRKALDLVMV